MKQTVYYRYLGTNGTIESPVHLEDIYYVRMLQLTSDSNKILTNGTIETHSIRIPEEELSLWHEIDRVQ